MENAPGTKAKRKIGLNGILLAAGFLFLANPLYACVDILPDTIGWMLIWFAIRSCAERNDRFYRARKWALVNAVASLLRVFFMFAFPVGSTLPSNVMASTAAAVLIDVAGMIVFFRAFYKGFEELSRSASDQTLYLKTENDRFLSVFFAIARAVCAFLPELTAAASLFTGHYGPEDLNVDDPEGLYLFLQQLGGGREMFWTIFAVFALIAAVVWLIHVLPRLVRFASDPGVAGKVNENRSEEELTASGRDRTGAGWLTGSKFLLGLSAVFCLDLQADGFRFLPFALFPAMLVLVLITLDRFRSAQHQEKLFKRHAVWFGASALLFLGFEFYRRFATVWDGRAFEETAVWQLILSALWLLAASFVLFCGWSRFALDADRLSSPYHGVGCLHLYGLPYWLLTIVCGLHLVSASLPALDRLLIAPRVIAIAVFAFVLFRRMSMLDEQIRLRLSEEPPEILHRKEKN